MPPVTAVLHARMTAAIIVPIIVVAVAWLAVSVPRWRRHQLRRDQLDTPIGLLPKQARQGTRRNGAWGGGPGAAGGERQAGARGRRAGRRAGARAGAAGGERRAAWTVLVNQQEVAEPSLVLVRIRNTGSPPSRRLESGGRLRLRSPVATSSSTRSPTAGGSART